MRRICKTCAAPVSRPQNLKTSRAWTLDYDSWSTLNKTLVLGAPSTPAEVWRTVTRGKQPSAMDWRTMENVPVIMACRRPGAQVGKQGLHACRKV